MTLRKVFLCVIDRFKILEAFEIEIFIFIFILNLCFRNSSRVLETLLRYKTAKAIIHVVDWKHPGLVLAASQTITS